MELCEESRETEKFELYMLSLVPNGTSILTNKPEVSVT
jgi:hypothetical protein